MSERDPPSLTPSQLNRQVRSLLESHYDFVWVEGEISNFVKPTSGHWYFTLKDDSAQVRCAMFRNRNQRVQMQPENGDAVRLRARVSLYEGRGEFQLIGEFMEAAGAGALRARFEALRDRLQAEGLFDQSRKKALPEVVNHLAIVTSPTGAALQDILKVLGRRNPAIRVTVLPTAVQGEQAPAQICRALERANRLFHSARDCDFDAIVVARGGGSLEDLWGFNDEQVARAIAASELPVITGIGHEVDVTIADFAADYRAPTPSAAAEMLSDDSEAQLQSLRLLRSRLTLAVERHVERSGHQLERLRARLLHPGARLREQSQYLDGLEVLMHGAMQRRLTTDKQDLKRLSQRLRSASPARRLLGAGSDLSGLRKRLTVSMAAQLLRQRRELRQHTQLLESLSPLAVLERGYAIVTDSDGRVLRRSLDVQSGDIVQARLAEGTLDLSVLGRVPGGEEALL